MSCLDNPEVLLKVFELALATKEGYQDLATLARTCRIFHTPALSLLWRTQTSLVPLILCFPREILHISRRVEAHPNTITLRLGANGIEWGDEPEMITVTFAKVPSLEDWKRPLIYAGFIKELRHHSDLANGRKEYGLTSSTLETLFRSCPVFPLLPRLRHLDCRSVFPNYDPHVVCPDAQTASAHVLKISSPTVLESLTLRLYYDWRPTCNPYDDGRILLAQVLERYPILKSLTIDNARGKTSVVNVADTTLNEPLLVFTAGDGSVLPTDLSIVGSFQCLTSFTLNARLPQIFDLVPSFPAIRKLDLACYASSAIHILKAITSSGLKDIKFALWNSSEDPSDWIPELCAVLASRVSWQESIQSIIFEEPLVSSGALEALFPLKNLVRLELCCLTIDDDLLEQAAKAWSMLESLAIFDDYTERRTSTLQSLVSLARHCPRLRSITLPLDATHIPPLVVDGSGSRTPRANLRSKEIHEKLYLEITGYSEVSDPAGVARFLLDLFPGFTLELVLDCDDEDSEWEEVVRLTSQSQD